MSKYFIASNSHKGFCSYYDMTFEKSKFAKIYVIKGGSGTGKGYFMKQVAGEAEKRGFSVDYIYCSSDSNSLDGIIINEIRIAVLDGTAPHIYEASFLGAIEEYVDLSQFLNNEMLYKSRKIIENVYEEKQKGFERAYKFLSAYYELSKNIESLILPCIKWEKLKSYAERFANQCEFGEGREEKRLCRSIGMNGLVAFDDYFEGAKIYYEINDYFESAHILTGELYSRMKGKGVDLFVSNNPIIPSRIDALCAHGSGITFEISNGVGDEGRTINMKRFVEQDKIVKIRADYRKIIRARDEVLGLALLEFENIKKHHFVMEQIYGAAMDFDAKEEYTREFCKKIFKNN